jgi:hypothetical protein
LEGDVESHRGQLSDVVADPSFSAEAAHAVVSAKIVEPASGIGKQLPDDPQD